MHEVFNMGTGLCCIVTERELEAALSLLREHYPGARRIGEASSEAGVVRVPPESLVGDESGFRTMS
jgi:phosphoribosylaminoimidazole (AIR) synthetase